MAVSSDVRHLIIRYANAAKRVNTFNDAIHHSRNINNSKDATFTKRTGGVGTVLCAEREPLDKSRWTKCEVVFRINRIESFGLSIGYVFGSIQDVDIEGVLGVHSNRKNSVGIVIRWNSFALYDDNHYHKRLKYESEDGPSKFPKQGQFWRLRIGGLNNEMQISVLNQEETDWIPMMHHSMGEEHRDIIPAFSLWDKGHSITLLSE